MNKSKLINLTNGLLTKEMLEKIDNMDIVKNNLEKGYDVILQLGKNITLPNDCSKLFNNKLYSKIIFDKGMDTSNVTNMSEMFKFCNNLTSINGLEYIDTSNVTDMSEMFEDCEQLESIDISKFNYDKVENLNWMFAFDDNLSEIKGIDKLLDKVKEISWTKSYGFLYCTPESVRTDYFKLNDIYSLFGIEVESDKSNNFDKIITINKGDVCLTSIQKILSHISEHDILINKDAKCKLILGEEVKLIDTFRKENEYGIFYNLDTGSDFKIESIEFKKGVDSSTMKDMSEMFYNCGNLKEIMGLENLDTSNVENMGWMFKGCSVLKSLNLSNFDTSNVTLMQYMFSGCYELQSLDVSSFDTSKVKNMDGMFNCCTELQSLDLSSFNTSEVNYMEDMFSGCSDLMSLDVSSFDTSKVTDMDSMFSCCYGLQSLDVSSFDTSKVTDMQNMFSDCKELQSLDLSNFNTSNVTSMYYMFFGCHELQSLDVSSFDTSKVTNVDSMFNNCYNLQSLDLSSFNTNSVLTMRKMFKDCKNLKNLDLSNFTYQNVQNLDTILSGCINLYEVNGFDELSNKINELNSEKPFENCDRLLAEKIDINVSKIYIYL